MDAGIRIRHVKSLPPMSFVVSDREIAATIEKMESVKMVQSCCSVANQHMPTILKQYSKRYGKTELIINERINDIKAGADLSDIEVIHRSPRAGVLYIDW